MSVLLDTNDVLSELPVPAPSRAVLTWLAAQHPEALFVSSMTQAEILLGARLLPAGKRCRRRLPAMFAEDFAGRILSFNSGAASIYAELARSRRSGRLRAGTARGWPHAMSVTLRTAASMRSTPGVE